MSQAIKVIGLGGANCFLAEAGDGFVLIDTGFYTQRVGLEKELKSAGCVPGRLKLIVLTHGDHDHAGNAAFLRETYGAVVAMHDGDSGMVEAGDMSWSRKSTPDRYSIVFRIASKIVAFFSRSGKFDMFRPDMYVEDGYDLAGYGLAARVVHIPGHSKGSLGILTASGDLCCGDLLLNFGRPGLHFMIDDLAAANASVERLRSLPVGTVYPGHGKPFPMKSLKAGSR